MGIHVALEHRTMYTYDRSVRLGPHVVRLRPAPHCRTPILSYSLRVEPEDHFVNWQQDPFGNHIARFVFAEPTTRFDIRVDLIADLTIINPFDFFVEDDAQVHPFTYDAATLHDLTPYLQRLAAGPVLDAWVGAARKGDIIDGMTTIDMLVAINQRVQRHVAYSVRMEPGVQTPDVTLQSAIGSCRDSGWLLVEALRALGIAARFVSGYLVQLAPDEVPLDGPAGPKLDFTDLHAWAEAYIPGAGWVGLDPTSGLFAGEGHIPLACTPAPTTAAPIDGLVDPADVTFHHENVVRRIREDPRVTKPYSDDQWAAIDALGALVDEALLADDVRLTMGGEPTFVSVDDYESAEWTIAADGPAKRTAAGLLARSLASRFPPGGTGAVLHHGQGKWYPGEALPRWQIALSWRHDGVALWNDASLLADPAEPGKATDDDLARLTTVLAAAFGVGGECVLPAYEDPLEALLREVRLPGGAIPHRESNPGPHDGRLADAESRQQLSAHIDAQHGRAQAFVMPLHWRVPSSRKQQPGWATTRWTLRRGALYLLPGDSPAGYRLPLASVAWTAPPDAPDVSALAPLSALPEAASSNSVSAAAVVVPVEGAPTTALVTEIRHGQIHVFLPPIADADVAIGALQLIESAAVAAETSIIIEGYGLPRDPRISTIVVAPDPGVIEVNVHPARTWRELTSISETVAEEARKARLGTETFGLDGRHSGTGGGSHLTIGAATTADSPILRRPDLLRSMLTFWQHHPSLSYLFSGRFIGPTSQSPRVDEARHDSLYELETAFAELDHQLAERQKPASPWLVDRLFRNLLVDLTGNTHRAEFCIDKLFSPESERGRLGLLELRGFEMPPHPRMALTQALLVRALIIRFWRTPYTGPLVRWGTELHDRFLLPWFCREDALDVVADLNAHGIAFNPAWLDPFVEFRFPLIGETTIGGVHLELRSAIEPWNVLGEETTSTGTARYVDSSVERLQIIASHLVEGRHAITVNGIEVPMHPTSVPGTAVAGVRFRAWQPPSALHPTIPVNSPLVFDVVDRWNGRSLGGCTYHVVHPGGRAYETFPVNAAEAESRRSNRFVPRGHTPGPLDPQRVANPGPRSGADYPLTVDLRRAPRPMRTAAKRST